MKAPNLLMVVVLDAVSIVFMLGRKLAGVSHITADSTPFTGQVQQTNKGDQGK